MQVPAALQRGEWVDVAIQIQADGELSVYMNREHLFTSRFLFTPSPGAVYRIALAGAAADTELLFRDVYLWRGARY